GPGTCIQNGLISGPASDKMSESISMNFVSKSMPDVKIHLNSDSNLSEKTTLLGRLPAFKASLDRADGHIVREGARDPTAGIQFEEVLATGMTPNGHVMGQFFTLEANSKAGNTIKPLLIADFWNGEREAPPAHEDSDLMPGGKLPYPPALKEASLSEAESVAL